MTKLDQLWQTIMKDADAMRQLQIDMGDSIRLTDVLRAIDKAERPGELYAITSSGTFIERELKTITPRILEGRMLSTGAGWRLRSDSLDAQSPETIDFLHALLCPPSGSD